MDSISDQYDSGLLGPREAISAALNRIERLESRIAALDKNCVGRITSYSNQFSELIGSLTSRIATLEAAQQPAPADTVTISAANRDQVIVALWNLRADMLQSATPSDREYANRLSSIIDQLDALPH